MLSGLTNINIELTDFCNKNCWMCGRRSREVKNPEIKKTYGFMDFGLVEKISKQVPRNIVVQFHNNGEALLYPNFGDAVRLFPEQIKNVVTNGKLLMKKYDEIVDNLDTISISIFENDVESEEQYEIVKEFMKNKGNRKPYTIVRCNGDVDMSRYEKMGLKVARRILHSPMGSFNYKRRDPTIPEIGICLDFLNHLAISKNGDVSICVRFDPNRLGVIGNIKNNSLEEIWNSDLRERWMQLHKEGKRENIPLCEKCEFWGVATQ